MVLGSIMLIVVVYVVYSNNQFSQKAIPVTGEVISYDSHESSDDDGGSTTMYTPTYGYSYNGKNYTYTSSTSSSSPDYDIGEKVEVLVDPDNPEEVLVNAFWERWLIVVILGFMGSMFTGLGYMAYRLMGNSNL